MLSILHLTRCNYDASMSVQLLPMLSFGMVSRASESFWSLSNMARSVIFLFKQMFVKREEVSFYSRSAKYAKPLKIKQLYGNQKYQKHCCDGDGR